MGTTLHSLIHLTRAGVSLIVATSASGVPVTLYWGRALGPLNQAELRNWAILRSRGVSHSAFDTATYCTLVPETDRGFTGRAGVELARAGVQLAVHPETWNIEVCDQPGSSAQLVAHGTDLEHNLLITFELVLEESGLVRARTSVANRGDDTLAVGAVRTSLPVGAEATQLLDLTGRWSKERTPQRHNFVQGCFERRSAHGRTGHDATLFLLAGTPGFTFGTGHVWAVHTAWSGNHLTYAERTPEGDSRLGGGELLQWGEVQLKANEVYRSPWLWAAYSESGMDNVSAQAHTQIRTESGRPKRQPKVVANTWEAVYFHHNLDRLKLLADKAAKVGVERFVLDDGWFLGRRNDRAGLGDWVVDPNVWPQGLHPLIEHVQSRGMEFGLWVEPETVNLDSELARAHPDWIIQDRGSTPAPWRHEHVLDLQQPGAYNQVLGQLHALLDEYPIKYLKWDHNRDVVAALHDGRGAIHGQTLAAYRLFDELRAAYPGLEIESCASGGGRIDAAVLAHTDRVWASDTIDALERQHLQRWTSLLVPPELLGSHIGAAQAHTTMRSHSLTFRAATALLFSFGIEWDLTALADSELEHVRCWVSLHKEVRECFAGGQTVRPDHADPAVLVQGVVSRDQSTAWFVVATVAATATQHPYPVRLAGLSPEAQYLVTDRTVPDAGPDAGPDVRPDAAPNVGPDGAPSGELSSKIQNPMCLALGWGGEPVPVSGQALMNLGIQLPPLIPETARVWHLQQVGEDT
jgi:alpha-galactosidase